MIDSPQFSAINYKFDDDVSNDISDNYKEFNEKVYLNIITGLLIVIFLMINVFICYLSCKPKRYSGYNVISASETTTN